MRVTMLQRFCLMVAIAMLVACGGGGGGSSNEGAPPSSGGSSPTTPPATPAPANPPAPQPAGSITLEWDANTESDLAGYKVYRGTASGTYGAPIATVSASATRYVATGLQSGATYFFVITAFDASGNESARSAEVSTTAL